MVRPRSISQFVLAIFALFLVLSPSAGAADEPAPAAQKYAWHSCAEKSVRFLSPVGWRLVDKSFSDGVTGCTLTAGPSADGALGKGNVTFKHWSTWPVSAGVQPSEYARDTIQKLSRAGRVVEQHSGAHGASLYSRIELVTTSGDQELHQWVLFVAHPRHATLDMVIAEWPDGSWDEASKVIQPTLVSLAFADQEE